MSNTPSDDLRLLLQDLRTYVERCAHTGFCKRIDDALARWGTQQQAPLTDEQIRSMCKESWVFETAKQWVRVVEASHGITQTDCGHESCGCRGYCKKAVSK